MPPLLGYRPIAACYLAGIDSSAYPYTSVRIRRRSRRARRRERIATNRLRRVERREKNRVHAESVREGLGRQECER